jgi:hypothetical protein
VLWSRTVRIDDASAAVESRLLDLQRNGITVRARADADAGRTYALVEGPDGVDPSEVETLATDGRWYKEAIIALAIEPAPPDALPALQRALGGPGAPAGVVECTRSGGRLLLEFRPDLTPAGLVRRIIEVELRRWGGWARNRLLTPLAVQTVAAIAAGGLQAEQIRSDRILESLLGLEHVE